ncbi:hypothetical protein B7463_g1409, partial [Scytalidium lignicola]
MAKDTTVYPTEEYTEHTSAGLCRLQTSPAGSIYSVLPDSPGLPKIQLEAAVALAAWGSRARRASGRPSRPRSEGWFVEDEWDAVSVLEEPRQYRTLYSTVDAAVSFLFGPRRLQHTTNLPREKVECAVREKEALSCGVHRSNLSVLNG